MFNEVLESIDEELANLRERYKYREGHVWKWSVTRLMADVGAAGAMDARVNGEGYDENWTVLQRRVVSILREERHSLRRAKDAELKRKNLPSGR